MILSLIEPSLPSELQRCLVRHSLSTKSHVYLQKSIQLDSLNHKLQFKTVCTTFKCLVPFFPCLNTRLLGRSSKPRPSFLFSPLFRLYRSQPRGHLRANKVFSVQFMQQETTHKLSFIKPVNRISVWIWDVLESAEKTPILVTNHTFRPPAAHFHYSFLIIRSNWVRENPPRTRNTSPFRPAGVKH